MKHHITLRNAPLLAVALLLAGCGFSPAEPGPGPVNRDSMRIDDERELEVWLLRPTTVDTTRAGWAET